MSAFLKIGEKVDMFLCELSDSKTVSRITTFSSLITLLLIENVKTNKIKKYGCVFSKIHRVVRHVEVAIQSFFSNTPEGKPRASRRMLLCTSAASKGVLITHGCIYAPAYSAKAAPCAVRSRTQPSVLQITRKASGFEAYHSRRLIGLVTSDLRLRAFFSPR